MNKGERKKKQILGTIQLTLDNFLKPLTTVIFFPVFRNSRKWIVKPS